MADFKKITQLFEDYLVKPSDFTEYKWMHDTQADCVTWTCEDDIQMLFDEEGETFSELSLEGNVEIGDYVLFTISDSCGGAGQVIFKASNKVEKPYE